MNHAPLKGIMRAVGWRTPRCVVSSYVLLLFGLVLRHTSVMPCMYTTLSRSRVQINLCLLGRRLLFHEALLAQGYCVFSTNS